MNPTERKPIFNGRYEIQSDGRVWSNVRNRYLKADLKVSGFRFVMIRDTKNGPSKIRLVHRLVAEAFLPKPDDHDTVKYEVMHIDGDKDNNNVSNLKWVTHQENMNTPQNLEILRRAAEKHRGMKYEKHTPHKTKTYEYTVYIDADGSEYRNLREIADKLNVTPAAVCHHIKHKTKSIRGHVFTKERREGVRN